MSISANFPKDLVPIEVALDRAGFGVYSYIATLFSGLAIISFACIGYGSTILVPTSACELDTTTTQQGLLAATPVIGSILGTVIWGYLADTRGRRSTLMAALLGGALVNSIASLSVNWIMLMVLQFVAAIMVSGLLSVSVSLMSESVPMEKRNLVVLLVGSIGVIAQGLMAVMAMPIIPLTFSLHMPALGIYWNSWRTLMLVYSVPALISAVVVFFMKESPKYVFSKGDETQALEILKTIHRVNHLRSNEELEVTGLLKEDSVPEGEKAPGTLLPQMFKAPLLKYTIIVSLLYMFQQTAAFVVWLPTIADQYVNNVESGNGTNLPLCSILDLSSDGHTNPDIAPCALNISALLIVLIVGAMQSIILILLSLIVNRVGRRNSVIVVAIVCGGSGILVNLIPNATASVVFFAIQLMGMVVMGMYTAMVVAIFPTHLKALALTIPLAFGRVATFAAIQILNLMLVNNCEAGFYVFASIFASSAIIAAFLPDDRRLVAAPPAPPMSPVSPSYVKRESIVESAR